MASISMNRSITFIGYLILPKNPQVTRVVDSPSDFSARYALSVDLYNADILTSVTTHESHSPVIILLFLFTHSYLIEITLILSRINQILTQIWQSLFFSVDSGRKMVQIILNILIPEFHYIVLNKNQMSISLGDLKIPARQI